MALAIRDAGNVSRSIAALVIRDATNTPRTIKELWLRTPDGLKQVFGQLAVTVSPTGVSGSVNRAGAATAYTRYVTASPSGGVAPFTYAWARTDGGAHGWAISSPTAAMTNFSTVVSSATDQTATFACTITDATGMTATSANVSADCWNDGSGTL
jgi:hypothetical protein